MAYNAASDDIQAARRHGAHDSALDVEDKGDMLKMRLTELEEENEILLAKATTASQRFADYENEIRVLRTQLREQQDRKNAQHVAEPESVTVQPERPSPGLSRLGSFMRKPASAQHGPSAREQELEAALVKEQKARIEAEKKAKEVTSEIEDLSTTLFQQANDMVATERRENAALKERIDELERAGTLTGDADKRTNEKLKLKIRILEQRDQDRQQRLEKLEAAQNRIDRVRTMLAPHG